MEDKLLSTSPTPSSQSSSPSPSPSPSLPSPPKRKTPTSLPKINTFTAPHHSPRHSTFLGLNERVRDGDGDGEDKSQMGKIGGGTTRSLEIPPTPIVFPPTPTPVIDKRGSMGSMNRRRSGSGGSGGGASGGGGGGGGRKSLDSVNEIQDKSKNGETKEDVIDDEVLADSPEDDKDEEMVTSPKEEVEDPISSSTIHATDNTGIQNNQEDEEDEGNEEMVASSPESVSDHNSPTTTTTTTSKVKEQETSSPESTSSGPSFRALHSAEAKEDEDVKRRETLKKRRRSRTSGMDEPEHGISTDILSMSPIDNLISLARGSRSNSENSEERTERESTLKPSTTTKKTEDRLEYEDRLFSSPEQSTRPSPRTTLSSFASGPSRSNTSFTDPPTASPLPKANTLAVDSLRAFDGSSPSASGPSNSPGNASKRLSISSSHSSHHAGSHRRSSSSHRVRETLNAKQHSTSQGQRMVNQYALGPTIGKGAYATVERGIDVGTGVEYAIKEFSKSRLKRQQEMRDKNKQRRSRGSPTPGNVGHAGPSGHMSAGSGSSAAYSEGSSMCTEKLEEDPLGLIRREVAVMKKLDHPNLVMLYEAIDVPSSDSLYLVLEYMKGGTLMTIKLGEGPAEPLDPETARSYLRQLVLGLEYLHENDVAHRDIKPDNVLCSADRKTVKLCDFGVSEMFASGDDRMKKSAGSPAFMSPETAISLQQDVHAKAVDVWALGVTLYCMIRGQLPFESTNPLELYDAIKTAPVPIPREWDEDLKDLVKCMLIKDPKSRITVSAIKEHPWLTQKGKYPMPSTEENLYEIGQQVEAPSEEEICKAISQIRGVFTVIRAVQKMRRLSLARRANTTSSNSSMQRSATLNAAGAAEDERPRLDLSQMTIEESDDQPMFSPDTSSSVLSSSASSRGTLGTDYFGTPGSRVMKTFLTPKRQDSNSLPNTRQSSVDDIELDKMRQAMDASPEEKAIAHTIQAAQRQDMK